MKKTNIIEAANIILPNKKLNLTHWAVVACDQYTSQPEYWRALGKAIGENPSTLNLILPEVYLKDDFKKLVEQINSNMIEYLNKNIFVEYPNSIVLVERNVAGKTRHGIVASIDLEHYEYKSQTKAFIRATEETVIERIPPRLLIRENAEMEFPHTIVLFDDKENKVMKEVDKSVKELIYDFDLNNNGGHIKGYLIHDNRQIIEILNELNSNLKTNDFAFAVGDGNHSLATAKEHWNKIKSINPSNQLARYALVELENIYDEGILFEPIHRLIFNADDFLFTQINNHFNKYELAKKCLYYQNRLNTIYLPDNNLDAIKEIQAFFDKIIADNPRYEIDYIHGEKDLIDLCNEHNALGIIMPCMRKEELFEYVAKKGSLPRKTFSMGEAYEKRYYLEGRKIR